MTVDIATLAIRIDSTSVAPATANLERMRDAGARAEQQTTALDAATRKLQGALALLGVGAGVGAIIRMADEYTKYNAQIKLATQSQREYSAAVDEVRRIANLAQQDLAATGTLYARIANGTRELGVQQKQVAAITETVNLALKVSGATAAESASAQLQLSQAFASGTLRGEEFNAVNEAAPRLMKALADGMGVPIGALRNMATEGQITSKIMADVLPGALAQLREEAKQVQTIGGAFTVLKNNIMEFVGVQAQASGTVSVLTTGTEALANNLNLLAGVTGTLAAVNVANWLTTWTTKTYERIVAFQAEIAAIHASRAATVAAAEAEVARTVTTVASIEATQAAIIVARAEMSARLGTSNANIQATQATIAQTDALIRQAQAAISASSAAGALSFALRVLRDSTRELNVQEALRRGLQADLAIAEQARAASLAELAILGQQQTRVSAAATAAATAQTAATTALATATTTAAGGVGLLSRAMGVLGGPIGTIVTLLGIAATAWSVWGNKSKEATAQAAESFDEAQVRIIKGLDEQIAKNEKLIQLQNGGVSKSKAERDLPIIDQLSKASKLLDDINNRAGDFAPGKGKSGEDVLFARLKVMQDIAALTDKMQKRDATGDQAAEGTRAQQLTKWYAENGTAAQRLAAELDKLKKQFGEIPPEMEKLVRAKFVDKAAASAIKAEQTAYQALMTTIREKVAANQLEMSGYNQLNESQKLTIKLDAEIATGKTKLNAGDIERARALISVVAATDAVIASNKRATDGAAEFSKMQKAHDDQVAKSIQAANDEVAKNEELVATFGMTKAAIEQLELARLQDQLAQRASTGLTADEIAALEKLIDAKKRNVAAVTKLEALDTESDVTKAKELLDILKVVDDAARQAASGMEASFGAVGKAIGGLTTALTGYAVQQQAIAAQLAAVKADPKSGAAKIAQAEIAASKASAQAQIKSYGDMAGAAKGFFKENSKGYKVMEGAEKAYRAVEMAMAIESMVTKSGLLTAFTGLFAASKAAEVAATVATVPPTVAAEGVKQTALATTAMAGAIAVPFPGNLAAVGIVAAMLAAIGLASGGGGGGGKSLSQQRQESQGTGTVFGDSTAKSDSIKRSLELMAGNSDIALSYTQGMLSALRNIESSLGGLGNLLVRTSGITSAAAGIQVSDSGGFFGKLVSSIFGGKTSVQDTGFTVDRTTLGAAAAGGVNSYSYADMKKSGGWFSSGKSWTDSTALGEVADAQFSKVLADLGAGVSEAAKLLGLGGDAFTERLNSFVIDIGKISLKGLTGEQIQDQLEAVFSKVGDDLAKFSVGGLEQFQQVGEGYFETLTRIASNYANLDSILAASGATFGQTGMASIKARENFIALAGGIDKVAGNFSSFNDNFLTQAERLAPVQKYVTDQLGALGYAGLDTRDKFKDAVLGLINGGALLTESGAATVNSLLSLADAFAQVYAGAKDVTKSAEEIADERIDLQNQLDELTMTQTQLAAKARAAIAPQNQALYDQVVAAQASKDAIAEANTVLDLQGQKYQALGDKAGAAWVLEQQHIIALKDMTPAVAAATKELWAAQAAEQTRKEALAINNGILANEAAYYEAVGDKAGAAAVAQQQWLATLAAMDPALRESATKAHDAQLQQKANNDALSISNSLLSIQAQIYEVTGDKAGTAAILQKQHTAALAAMDPALRGATQALWDAQAAAAASQAALTAVNDAYADLQTVVGIERDKLNSIYEAASDGIQKNIDKVTDSVSKLKSLSDALHSTLDSLTMPGQEVADRQAAQAQVEAALAIAKAGGPLPTADALKNALATLAKDPSDQFASFSDYQREMYRTINNVTGLAGLTDVQLTAAEATLKVLQDQKAALDDAHKKELAVLDETLNQAKLQTELLGGVAASLMTLPDALAALANAVGNATKDPGIGTDALTGLYKDVLGRAPDAAGLKYWQGILAGGADINYVKSQFMSSAEYQGLHPFAVGTNYVPRDMPAYIHEGEAIIPAADNRELMSRLSSPAANVDVLVAELRAQREENAQLREIVESHLYAIAKNTLNTADTLEASANGDVPLATKEVAA